MATHLHNVRVWDGSTTVGDSIAFTDRVCTPGATCERIDGGGRRVTPGLVDAHLHLVLGAESRLGVDLTSVRSKAAFVEALARGAIGLDSAPGAEAAWLRAQGWNESNWGAAVPPDLSWLESFGDRPVVCWRCDLHAALVNRAVLEQLDLPASSRAWETGLLVEAEAWEILNPVLPAWHLDARRRALGEASKWLVGMGVTGVRTMEYRDALEQVIDPLAEKLDVRVVVTLLDRALPLSLDWIAHRTDALPKIIGCKAFLDGTLGSRTARLRAPYLEGSHLDTCGLWVEVAAEGVERAWCDEVVAAGLAPSVHAIGDAAVDRAIALLSGVPDALRPTIEHAELLGEGALKQAAALRLSVQPVHRAEDASMALRCLGAARAAQVLPLRRLHLAGARLAFGTDWPVTSADPMRTLRAAITGNTIDGEPFYVEEALDNEAAMRAMTVAPAEAVGLPTAEGLAEGALADLVLWNGDPLTWDGCGAPPSPAAVWIGGRLVAGSV
jgi:predicted amidohydrolase YtcJ